jgi:hypothetical protein
MTTLDSVIVQIVIMAACLAEFYFQRVGRIVTPTTRFSLQKQVDPRRKIGNPATFYLELHSRLADKRLDVEVKAA